MNSKFLRFFTKNSRFLYTGIEVISVIGERLADIRKDHGDTQQTLADKLQVSKFTVSNWEQEKSEPDHESLIKICKLYRISSDYLLGLSDIDPVYAKTRKELFSKEEQALMKEFESFLRWRSQKRVMQSQ